MGVSIGAAIDYLVAGLVAPLVAVDPAAVVIDGEMVLGQESQSMVYIGKRDPSVTSAADGMEEILVLGAGRVQEDYEIPCVVWASRPGPAMKPARDAAIAMFDAVAHFLASDRTLGGLLLQGRFAEFSTVSLDQVVAGDAGALRVVWLSFSIHVRNHYIP